MAGNAAAVATHELINVKVDVAVAHAAAVPGPTHLCMCVCVCVCVHVCVCVCVCMCVCMCVCDMCVIYVCAYVSAYVRTWRPLIHKVQVQHANRKQTHASASRAAEQAVRVFMFTA